MCKMKCGVSKKCVLLMHWKLEAEKTSGLFLKQNNVKTFKIEKLHLMCDHLLGSYYQNDSPGCGFFGVIKG